METPFAKKIKIRQPYQKQNENMYMKDINSLLHTKWRCHYHTGNIEEKNIWKNKRRYRTNIEKIMQANRYVQTIFICW